MSVGSAKQREAHDLRLSGLQKHFGSFHAVRGIDLHVPAGEMVSLIGSSGCGKTTTLRMIAGLEAPSAGTIASGGVTMSEGKRILPPEARGMGMVFQTYALWPHMSVAENVGYGLKQKKVSRADIEQRVRETLEIVNMSQHGSRYPSQLSGGQQQRVALARAITSEPRTLLFDEPLSNLDAVLREQMRFEIRSLQQRLGITAVYVTHSQEEALALSDSIAVMREGLIVQTGKPADIYNLPRNAFVANFIGLANIISLDVVARDGDTLVGAFQPDEPIRSAGGRLVEHTGDTLTVCVRPVDFSFVAPGAAPHPGQNRVSGTVQSTVFTGGLVDYFVVVEGRPDQVLRVQSTPPVRAHQGERVVLEFDPARTVALEP